MGHVWIRFYKRKKIKKTLHAYVGSKENRRWKGKRQEIEEAGSHEGQVTRSQPITFGDGIRRAVRVGGRRWVKTCVRRPTIEPSFFCLQRKVTYPSKMKTTTSAITALWGRIDGWIDGWKRGRMDGNLASIDRYTTGPHSP